ncbi:exodeoxyribonuclease VII small subunit [Aquibaculum arenosum]|uniref:Exodeoxyribonuclease 7 small subunit n=1 Tax=Aquibaculum arenosum TaxID=3032591 RepID=A0ABT5YMQ0_9PROT|nr:exodeoxyribonuclease VII small subunit [Fodinicurvata sp. CAU 1616]MDF2096240.1 exodeoxyribonuclease VII small subunit [Fodinicurvata sp. CAU 1616]
MADTPATAAPVAKEDVTKLSFEEALEELKDIVKRLESGEGRLDEAIEAYERGANLKQQCEKKLQEAQAKIERIGLGSDGTPTTSPFESQ